MLKLSEVKPEKTDSLMEAGDKNHIREQHSKTTTVQEGKGVTFVDSFDCTANSKPDEYPCHLY